jgi:predicted MFS family arabinose efflux permease
MALTEIETRPYRWVVLSSWQVCHATSWGMVVVFGILLPSISSEFQLSYIQQGLLSSIPVWIMVVLTIPLSVWLVRYRPNILTTVTLALGTVFLFLQAFAATFVILLVSRLAFGLTMAAREPIKVRLIHQWFPPREYLLANGVIAGILNVVFTAAMVATPLFLTVSSNDWRTPLYIFGGFFAFLSILWAILGRQRATQEGQLDTTRTEASLLKGVLRHKEMWMAGVGLLGINLACGCFLTFYPTYMLDRYDTSLTLSGTILALSFAASGIISFQISRIATNWKSRANTLYLAGLILSCSYILLLVTDSLPILLILGVLNGMAWGCFPILITVPFNLRDIRIRELPVANAFLFTNLSLGLAIGPVLAGFLQDTFGNLAAVLVFMSLPCLSLVLAGFFVRTLAIVSPSHRG